MQRCVAICFLLIAWVAPVTAQLQRNFPATALRAEMQITLPPQLLLNGRDARLAPGARILDENNFLTMSGSLADRRLVIHYTLNTEGLLFDVWVLTPAEMAKQPWPRSLEEARTWVFDPIDQSWAKP